MQHIAYIADLFGHRVTVLRLLAGANVDSALVETTATLLAIVAQDCSALLSADTNVSAIDMDGETPLNSATKNRHHDVVAVLIDTGADIDFPDAHRWAPLVC